MSVAYICGHAIIMTYLGGGAPPDPLGCFLCIAASLSPNSISCVGGGGAGRRDLEGPGGPGYEDTSIIEPERVRIE